MAICAAAATGIPELGSAAAAGLFHVRRLDFPENPLPGNRPATHPPPIPKLTTPVFLGKYKVSAT
jgi:hypothetical protein